MTAAPPVLSIVGASGSGKTTLIERLLPRFAECGLRVATIKHAHHGFEPDVPGKDSWRHLEAGAHGTLLVGPAHMRLVRATPPQASPASLAARWFPDADLVLAEGFSSMPGAKIEVVRTGVGRRPCVNDGLVAVAADDPTVAAEVPVLDLNDAEAVAAFIRRWIKETRP